MLQKLPSAHADPSAVTLPDPAPLARQRRGKRSAGPQVAAPQQPARRAARWLDRLSVAQKLGLAGVLFGVPTILTTYMASDAMNQQLMPIAKAEHIIPMVRAVDAVQTNLDAFTLAVVQNSAAGGADKAALDKAAQNVNQSIAALEAELMSEARPNPISRIRQVRAEIRKEVQISELKETWEAYRVSASTNQLTNIANDYAATYGVLQEALEAVGHASSLEVGGGVHSIYFLKEATLEGSLMALRHSLTQANTLAHSVMARSLNSSSDQQTLIGLLTLLELQKEKVVSSIDEALADGKTIPEDVATQAAALAGSVDTVQAALENVTRGLPASNLNALTRDTTAQAVKLTDDALEGIRTESIQLQVQEGGKGAVSLLLVFLFSGLAVALLVALLRQVVTQLRKLTDGAQKLSQGDLDIHVPVTSADELGTLTTSFNSAAQQLRENAVRVEQERLEATKLQQHIGDFLDVTMDIAEGDLTKRGKVTDDVLGNVVDSINLMTDELAQVLKTVQSTSASVQGGSETMRLTTEQIQHGAQLTADETLRVAQRVQDITSAIRQMADSAQQSAQTARQALLASQQGQDAVENTLDGMQNIRRQVQSMSKRIKSLGDRSLEIQEIADTVSKITRRTHLLSLNAAVEASGVGVAGHRFNAVAEEVRQLADTSGQATARITALIKTVQAEVQDVIASVEDNAREVEQGYRVAGQAGERLREISALTQQSAQLADQVADGTQAQVAGVDQVRGAVEQIAAVARDSQSSVQQGRQAAEQLQSLAHELNTNLARFRLPG